MDPVTLNLQLFIFVTATKPSFFASLGLFPLFLVFVLISFISLFYLKRLVNKHKPKRLLSNRDWRY